MARYKYAFSDYDKEKMARCAVISASVSTKHCIEICNVIRGKKTETAKRVLDDAIALKKPIPFRRFNDNVGHKKASGPARFPVKACTEILQAIEACEANAQAKGLSTADLVVTHISSNLASRPWHYGRARRRKSKRTHIEIVLLETGAVGKAKKKEADKKKEDVKADADKAKAKTTEKKIKEKPEKPVEPVEKEVTKKPGQPVKTAEKKPAQPMDKPGEKVASESKQIKKEEKSPEKKQQKTDKTSKPNDESKDKGAMKDGPKKHTGKED